MNISLRQQKKLKDQGKTETFNFSFQFQYNISFSEISYFDTMPSQQVFSQ